VAAIDVVRFEAAQRDQAAEMLARAFREDPIYTALFSDPDELHRSTRSLWRGVLKYCLMFGEVYTTPDVKGAAAWVCPGNDMNLWRTIRSGFAMMRAVAPWSRDARGRLLNTLGPLDAIHKQVVQEPHWYLWVLGVDPGAQGQGIGGKLVAPVLDRADRDGTPCYLETETEWNVAFYRRRGFEVVHEAVVPGETFTMWSMLRKA
jgi:ribosomal protein S18 acetylase RimI-like enzyme